MAKSVDLTTLSGWASLSTGSHNITIVAKAVGYKDSAPSAGVTVTKAPQEYTDCITFTGETSDFTLKATYKEWNGTVEYSTDHNTWTVWNGSIISSVDKKLYLRGSGNTTFWTKYGARFVLSAKAGCSGNLNTLLEHSNPPTKLSANCYYCMFRSCTNLTKAPSLPATTLAMFCYESMFYGCTNLATAPAELPATVAVERCYEQMFRDCTSLTTAPALLATTLAGSDCYSNMFRGCTSLTTVPALPATTLTTYCYQYMFYGCTSFKVSSTQTGAYKYAWRIPTSGTASSKTGWNDNMLANTGGTFKSNPSTNTTYYVENAPV